MAGIGPISLFFSGLMPIGSLLSHGGFSCYQKEGMMIDFRRMFEAIENDDFVDIKDILKDGYKSWLFSPHGDELLYSNKTPLMYAAQRGKVKALKLLISYMTDKSDVNVVNHKGVTALMFAAFAGQLQCVKALIDISNVTYVSPFGESALRPR
jgi:ankyrin repeat protein